MKKFSLSLLFIFSFLFSFGQSKLSPWHAYKSSAPGKAYFYIVDSTQPRPITLNQYRFTIDSAQVLFNGTGGGGLTWSDTSILATKFYADSVFNSISTIDTTSLSNRINEKLNSNDSIAGGYYPYTSNPKNYIDHDSALFITSPFLISNGTYYHILGMHQSDNSTDGYLSSTDWNTFNNKLSTDSAHFGTNFINVSRGTNTVTFGNDTSIVHSYDFYKGVFYPLSSNPAGYLTSFSDTATLAGTGISISRGSGKKITVTNSAPDQTVTLTSGTGISATGTYPNFTITNTKPDTAILAGSNISIARNINGNTITGTGTISGISLGSNLATHTLGYGLTGTSYNGSTAVTTIVDTASANGLSTKYYIGSRGYITNSVSTLSSLTSVGTITSGTWSSTIGSSATGTTQSVNDNSTKISTTAYADRMNGAGYIYIDLNTVKTVGAGTWTIGLNTGAEKAEVFNSTRANGDYITLPLWLQQGTYTFFIQFDGFTSNGIADISIDNGVTVFTSVDMYSASLTVNRTSTASIVVASSGAYTFRFKANGKNASSTNFTIAAQYCVFVRTL